jgi:16S rRNA (cytosine967-C5)-methyltransferase
VAQAQFSARRAALAALRVWRVKRRFADAIIASLPAADGLRAADRAFVQELFYGVLRNLLLLDFWINHLRSARLNADLRDILRLGLYQLFILETAEHAAVFETVELASTRHRSLINGILRSALRRKTELRAQAGAQPLYVQLSHPKFLVTRWQRFFGRPNAEALCRWDNRPPPIYARVNGLKISAEQFLHRYAGARRVADCAGFVEFEPFARDAVERGECYIQDPSTAIACRLANPQPGETVLDACAAPGGKTGYLAELMENRGTIVACDRDRGRATVLRENLSRLGVRIGHVLCLDWTRAFIPKEVRLAAPFDRILLDAPCSNTGVMRRRVDVRWRLHAGDFIRMQQLEMKIIRSVSRLLKPGGTLVYSTCSLEQEENEEVVDQVLAGMPTFQLKETKRSLPFRDKLDGAFAARFIKTG